MLDAIDWWDRWRPSIWYQKEVLHWLLAILLYLLTVIAKVNQIKFVIRLTWIGALDFAEVQGLDIMVVVPLFIIDKNPYQCVQNKIPSAGLRYNLNLLESAKTSAEIWRMLGSVEW